MYAAVEILLVKPRVYQHPEKHLNQQDFLEYSVTGVYDHGLHIART